MRSIFSLKTSRIIYILFVFLSCGDGYAQTHADTLYTIAVYYHKGLYAEHKHDDYVFKKIEYYYLKALEENDVHYQAHYGLGVLYYHESKYFEKLSRNEKKYKKKSVLYLEKSNAHFKRYTDITGQKVD